MHLFVSDKLKLFNYLLNKVLKHYLFFRLLPSSCHNSEDYPRFVFIPMLVSYMCLLHLLLKRNLLATQLSSDNLSVINLCIILCSRQ
jgi:hypothetical protein